MQMLGTHGVGVTGRTEMREEGGSGGDGVPREQTTSLHGGELR